MRYFQYLMIPAAFLAGVFAVSSVQAQTAYMQPSLYSKTGYQPVAAGSYVSYSANGQGHTILANDASYYVKSQVVDPRQNVTLRRANPLRRTGVLRATDHKRCGADTKRASGRCPHGSV